MTINLLSNVRDIILFLYIVGDERKGLNTFFFQITSPSLTFKAIISPCAEFINTLSSKSYKTIRISLSSN